MVFFERRWMTLAFFWANILMISLWTLDLSIGGALFIHHDPRFNLTHAIFDIIFCPVNITFANLYARSLWPKS